MKTAFILAATVTVALITGSAQAAVERAPLDMSYDRVASQIASATDRAEIEAPVQLVDRRYHRHHGHHGHYHHGHHGHYHHGHHGYYHNPHHGHYHGHYSPGYYHSYPGHYYYDGYRGGIGISGPGFSFGIGF